MPILSTMTVDGWRSGAGDPSLLAWLTTALYLVVALACLAAWRAERRALATTTRRLVPRFWLILGLGLLALAANKELDLQMALTVLGRKIARAEHLDGSHHGIMLSLTIAEAAIALAILALFIKGLWKTGWRYITALGGMTAFGGYVMLRILSFNHIDMLVGHTFAGVAVRSLIEIGSLVIIAAGAVRCARPIENTK